MIAKKIQKTANFTIVDNEYLRDENLSFKAKGILTYFLSLPGDWVIYFDEVITHSTDGIRSFRSGVDELIKEGYIRRYPIRENGQIVRWETEIYEKKQTPDSQNVEEALVEVNDVLIDNDSLLSTNTKTNTDGTNNLYIMRMFERILTEWNILGYQRITKEEVLTNVKRTVNFTDLINTYGESLIIKTINQLKDSAFNEKYYITFDWFIRSENFEKMSKYVK